MQQVWQQIVHWDQALSIKINKDGSNAFFDFLMPWLRQSLMWAPLYLFLIVFAIQNFKAKGGRWVMYVMLTASISDLTSSRLIKNYFARPRPCNEPAMQQALHFLVNHCPGGFSFTSSHATNHFAVAAFIYFTGRHLFGTKLRLFFVWAASICYAQVYVGVHYPFDVLCGALLGTFIGYLMSILFNKYFKLSLPATL
jgi:membrane-associated phospholipid phosphatase